MGCQNLKNNLMLAWPSFGAKNGLKIGNKKNNK